MDFSSVVENWQGNINLSLLGMEEDEWQKNRTNYLMM
jgi:hypothetical protein